MFARKPPGRRSEHWKVALLLLAAITVMTIADRSSVDARLWDEVRRQYRRDLPLALGFSPAYGSEHSERHVYLMFPASLFRMTLIYASASPRAGIAIKESREQLLWGVGILAAGWAWRFGRNWRRRTRDMDRHH
jgi:hypothetical protein